MEEIGDDSAEGGSSDEIKIVTVTTEDIVTLATEALAGSAVAQLTGQYLSGRTVKNFLEIRLHVFIGK